MAKVLISMREEFLDKIDELADKEQRSRSELIRQAIRVYMRKKRMRGNTPGRYPGRNELLDTLLID